MGAFEALYKKHFAKLLNSAFRKTGNREAAEEIVQDTYLYLYLHAEKVRDNPRAYLYTVLCHKVIDYFRRKMEVETTGLEEDNNRYAGPYDASEQVRAKELSAEINKRVAGLPNECRKVFLLRREEELSNKAIAERLGISIKTVEAQMTKALRILRANLDYHLFWLVLLGYTTFF